MICLNNTTKVNIHSSYAFSYELECMKKSHYQTNQVLIYNSGWKASLFTRVMMSIYKVKWTPGTLINGSGEKRRTDKQKGEECRAEKAHIINHGDLADVRLLLNTG